MSRTNNLGFARLAAEAMNATYLRAGLIEAVELDDERFADWMRRNFAGKADGHDLLRMEPNLVRAAVKVCLAEEAKTPVFARTVRVYKKRSDKQNWDDLLEQVSRVACHDYESTGDDHRKTLELLWNYFEGKGSWLREHYEQAKGVRDDSKLGVFVKVYESTVGLSR
ncbi:MULTISPECIES: hypothetical protein [Streptomyces]|uniref:hypothetical protein n=1 Tax=Streptomyces TaxID=1883 RepID=UPI00345B828D